MTSTPLKNLLEHYANLYSIGLPWGKKTWMKDLCSTAPKEYSKQKRTTEINERILGEAGRGSFSAKKK